MLCDCSPDSPGCVPCRLSQTSDISFFPRNQALALLKVHHSFACHGIVTQRVTALVHYLCNRPRLYLCHVLLLPLLSLPMPTTLTTSTLTTCTPTSDVHQLVATSISPPLCLWHLTPYHLPLTIHPSPITIQHSLLTTHHSPLATSHSPCITCHLLPTALLTTTHCLPPTTTGLAIYGNLFSRSGSERRLSRGGRLTF